ncbi:MAG: cytochrome c oxidase subunit II [Pseudomonadota bacterium]
MNSDMPDAALSPGFRLLAQSASTAAGHTDALFLAMLLLCGGMALLLAFLVVFFAIKYRAGSDADRTAPPSNARGLEAAWTAIPLVLFLGIFLWAAYDYVQQKSAPADALPVYVTGKQWMWKLQHRSGRREINELHVPLGQPVKLIMTSEDVIHSFFIPAFRLKQDLVPGRYTSLWFTATQLGDFRIFCAEYCGSEHSAMIGRVVVMAPAAFARWLAEGPAEPGLVARGAELFRTHGCSGCHAAGSTVHAPLLDGLAGRTVHLQDGRTVVADETYIRDALLLPQKDVVAGFEPVMPSFAGQLSEDDVQALIAYLHTGGTPP